VLKEWHAFSRNVKVVTEDVAFYRMYNHLSCSAFGHLDGIHTAIRSNNQMLSLSDAQIRFERGTEMHAKSHQVVEEVSSAYVCRQWLIFVRVDAKGKF
jgi:hypothetical protein